MPSRTLLPLGPARCNLAGGQRVSCLVSRAHDTPLARPAEPLSPKTLSWLPRLFLCSWKK